MAILMGEGIYVNLVSVYKLPKKYEYTGSVVDSNRKVSALKILLLEHLHFFDEILAESDELTGSKLPNMLEQRCRTRSKGRVASQ